MTRICCRYIHNEIAHGIRLDGPSLEGLFLLFDASMTYLFKNSEPGAHCADAGTDFRCVPAPSPPRCPTTLCLDLPGPNSKIIAGSPASFVPRIIGTKKKKTNMSKQPSPKLVGGGQ